VEKKKTETETERSIGSEQRKIILLPSFSGFASKKHQRAMTSPRKAYFVARVAVLLLAAISVAMTKAWIITSPGTMVRIREKSSPCRSSSSFVKMSSYEEQYANFAQQHQTQKELQYPLPPFAQENQIGDEDISNQIVNPSTNYLDPIREETPNASSKLDVDQKSQEELEMAFLDFISCSSYESQLTSPMYDVGSEQQENPQHDLDESDELPKNDTNDDIEDASRTDPSDFVSTTPLTDSDPRYGAEDSDITSTTEFASSSASLSTDSTAASTTNSLNDDGAPAFPPFVGVASKGPPLSASTSYLDNIGSVSVSDDESSDVADSVDVIDSDSDSDSDDNYSTVEVRVETTFPTGVTVEDAKRGWLEFCWAKGGGIVVPAAVSKKPPSASNADYKQANHAPDTIKFETEEQTNNNEVQDRESSSSSSSIEVELPTGIPSSRDLIVPLGMKQRLVSSTSTLDKIQTDTIRRDIVTYKSTDTGLFCKDMIENTHEGRVEFIGASYTATRMIWTVIFQVEQEEEDCASNQDTTNVMDFASATKTKVETMMSKANLWGSWSEFQLKTASQNLIAYMDNSADAIQVLEHTETLPVGVSPREGMEAWYAYYWKNGGGAIPITVSSKNGIDKRWIIPTGLEEELVSLEYDRPVSESMVVGVDGEITTETEIAEAVYKVNNPNLLTYPVYYNRATVRFLRDGEESPTRLIWKVEVKPYRKILAGGVLFWTKNNITLASRNLRKYLEIQQLEREERELKDQLNILRTKNPASSSSGSRSDNKKDDYDDAEKDDQNLFEGLKTIRSTLSISSAQAALAIEDKEEPANTGNNENSNGNSDNTTVDEENGNWQSLQKNPEGKRPASPGVVVDEKTAASTVKPDDEEERTTRSMFMPDFNSMERGTIVIDTHTHAVDDEGTREIWQ